MRERYDFSTMSAAPNPYAKVGDGGSKLIIDIQTARRFILGKQGLWPGRRWQGLDGTELAMRETEYLQLDPLQIITRSQDIQLHSRVSNYSPALWEEVTYQQRKFFDWGGWLAARPMNELPYWRTVMHRERDGNIDCDRYVRENGLKYADTVKEMRALLQERGTVSNRDFAVKNRQRTEHYRGRKDSSLALYYLWRTGEVMTHHREKFERVYALTEQVAPAHLIREASDEETDRFLIKKEISFAGLSSLKKTGDAFLRGIPFSKRQQLCEQLLAANEITEVSIEGLRAKHYVLNSDIALLDEIAAGRIPEQWKPLDTTTTDEVAFLSPLDPVSARGRAKIMFDFDYVWEVYKPKDKRKFGYYTLPVLWGDQLVARFDSQLDRETNTFIVLGFWLEDEKLAHNEDFAEALARGFLRFTKFLGAKRLNAKAIRQVPLRKCVNAHCKPSFLKA